MYTLINMVDLFPFGIIKVFFSAFAVYNICYSLQKSKFNSVLTFLLIFSARVAAYSIHAIDITNSVYMLINLLLFYGIVFIILCITTTHNLRNKITLIVFCLLSHFTITMISGLTDVLAAGGDFNKYINPETGLVDERFTYAYTYIIHLIITVITSYLFSGILKILKNKNRTQNSKTLNILTFFPVTHIIIFVFGISLAPVQTEAQYIFDKDTDKIIFIIYSSLMIIILIFDTLYSFIINRIEQIIEKNNKYEKELLKNTMDYHQMLMLKQEKQEFRKIKHDFANIITTAKGFIEIDKPEKALNILSNTNEDLIGLAGFSVCSNETINTVLYIKTAQAEKNNIDLNIEIEENAAVLIDDYDLCRLLHNLIDNTMNAVLQLDSDRYCKISIEIDSEQLLIKTENKFNNSDSKRKNKKSSDHGNGTGIIKSIASKYNGKYTYNQTNNVWNTETFLINKKPANSTPPEVNPKV